MRSCVRPVYAVRMTAGPDEVRLPGPVQSNELECPDSTSGFPGCGPVRSSSLTFALTALHGGEIVPRFSHVAMPPSARDRSRPAEGQRFEPSIRFGSQNTIQSIRFGFSSPILNLRPSGHPPTKPFAPANPFHFRPIENAKRTNFANRFKQDTLR